LRMEDDESNGVATPLLLVGCVLFIVSTPEAFS